MKTKYAVFLGLDCAMAGLLKDAGVRAFSSPFDWLDSSDAKTRVSLIESEFKDFLNIKDLEQIFIENDPQVGVDRYRNNRTKLCFHHDFRSDLPFEEAYKKVAEKYNRRIKNFLYVYRQDYKVTLFVLDRFSQMDDQSIKDVFDTIKQYVVVISNCDTVDKDSYVQTKITDHIFHYKVNNTPTDVTEAFQKFKGNIPIIKQIILQHSKKSNFFDKKTYECYKWLRKKLSVCVAKNEMSFSDKLLFRIFCCLQKKILFTPLFKDRKEDFSLYESLIKLYK